MTNRLEKARMKRSRIKEYLNEQTRKGNVLVLDGMHNVKFSLIKKPPLKSAVNVYNLGIINSSSYCWLGTVKTAQLALTLCSNISIVQVRAPGAIPRT